jgi:hypothetical protein
MGTFTYTHRLAACFPLTGLPKTLDIGDIDDIILVELNLDFGCIVIFVKVSE